MGQPDPFGQQGGFGQPGQFGGGPGYPGGPGDYPQGAPKKKKTGLIIAIVLIAVLVVGGGIGAFFLFSKDDATARAEEWASTYEEAGKANFTGPGFQKLKTLVCSDLVQLYDGIAEQVKRTNAPAPSSLDITVTGVQTEGEKGTFTFKAVINGKAQNAQQELVKQGEEWKVCKPNVGGTGGGTGGGGSEPSGSRIPAPDPN